VPLFIAAHGAAAASSGLPNGISAIAYLASPKGHTAHRAGYTGVGGGHQKERAARIIDEPSDCIKGVPQVLRRPIRH